MFSWITFLLVCSFAPLNRGGIHNDIPTGVQYQMHAKEAIIKTFEMDNMVIDCVDIYKQPAFQHILLGNHTLQLKSNYPDKTNDFATEASYPWNSSKSCPEGYIPIERIKGNGQFAGDILKVHSHKHPNPIGRDGWTHEHSAIRASNEGYYGGKATLNVWNPKLDSPISGSVAQLWVTTESYQDSIEAGWLVDPQHFGTYEPRFFIFTTDKITGNWWLRLQGADIGYWPKELVPTLAEGARIVDFGGEVAFKPSGVHPIIEMGSGHFPYEGFRKASFFRNVQVLDLNYKYQTHVSIKEMNENKGCYDLHVAKNRDGPWGLFFFYGGPGKSENCHIAN